MPITTSATGATPFPVDPARTAIIQTYIEPGMIADRVLPPTPPQPTSAFSYLKMKKADAFQVPDVRLGRTGQPNRVEFDGDEVTDRTDHYGLMDSVPQEDIDAANLMVAGGRSQWVDPVDYASLMVTQQMKLAREVRVADKVFNTASYDATLREVLGANDKFDVDASSPWKIFEEALTKPLLRPNVVIFGQEAWSKFRLHPKVLKATNNVSGADAGMATRMAVAAILEVDEVLVGRSRVASNVEGQDVALKRAWGKNVALIYRGAFAANSMPGGMAGSEAAEMSPMVSDLKMQTFGFTAVYEPLMSYGGFNPKAGIKGCYDLLVRESCKEVVSGGDAHGYYLSEVVS